MVDLLDEAISQAIPALNKALTARRTEREQRPRIKLTVTSDANPALVEIDGVLVGTTPLEGFELYKGDHVLTVGKPGYRDVTKRILFDKDTRLEVPLFRAELTADELVQSVHAHPTLSEVLMEAAHMAEGAAIHI